MFKLKFNLLINEIILGIKFKKFKIINININENNKRIKN